MMGLSLLFFLLFVLSARGQSVRLYQQKIYVWNKERIGELIQTVDFRYKIVPYATQSLN